MFEMRAGLSPPRDKLRRQISPSCDGQEPPWRTLDQKARQRPRQIRSVKTNASEPLKKGRNLFQTRSKPGTNWVSGSSAGEDLFATGTASGLEAESARNRLRHGTLEPVVPMPRESCKRGDRESESTEVRAERSSAGHRDGTARSSDEASVMDVERRGRVIAPRARGSTLPQQRRSP